MYHSFICSLQNTIQLAAPVMEEMEGKRDDSTPAKNLKQTALQMDISCPLLAIALVVPPLLGLQTVQG